MRCWSVCAGSILVLAAVVSAQAPVPPPTPPNPVRPGAWRMAGNTPCVGPWGGIYECPPAPRPWRFAQGGCSTASPARC